MPEQDRKSLHFIFNLSAVLVMFGLLCITKAKTVREEQCFTVVAVLGGIILLTTVLAMRIPKSFFTEKALDIIPGDAFIENLLILCTAIAIVFVIIITLVLLKLYFKDLFFLRF